ncbi:MAG: UDP-3-O-[3-hydroxymyristoyl] N-acetylglucosamine deacetylase [Armatimonadetes bacterium]|nr:UDP-3-O-[3-hydroxymyristoyl] N-acetylglucosamine deacetylase [Armatimonadota bacterium]
MKGGVQRPRLYYKARRVGQIPGRQRTTIASPVVMEGVGLHTGEKARLTLKPCAGKGRVCVRTDLQNAEIPLLIESVAEVEWATTLSGKGATIHTVEHLLAAAYALGIDDLRVEIDGEEFPAADGSSLPYVELLDAAGVVESEEVLRPVTIRKPIWVGDGDKHLLALPCDRFTVTYAVDYHHAVIGRQVLSLEVTPESFRKELAAARTFALVEWVDALRRQGLAQGGSLANAVVVYSDHYSGELRFEDEMVRHKALDLVGDLALIGRPVHAHFIALRCSHAMHIEMARRIRDCTTDL